MQTRYGTSSYIYLVYGLGGLPEGLSRRCAIHGGTFMFNRDVYNEAGTVVGVKIRNEMARAKFVVGDPSLKQYVPPATTMSGVKTTRWQG